MSSAEPRIHIATPHHVAPTKLYYGVFGALIVGTILTVVAASIDMGPLNNVVMLTIAVTKATLVVLYFMHVRWGSRLTWVVVASGFFWLLIMFTFTMTDYLSRGWLQGTLR
jgi:cytochrome c oxidase subunit IV